MASLISKVLELLPVAAALMAALSALGLLVDSVSKALGKSQSSVGKFLGMAAGLVKKIIDVISGNIAH